MMAAVHEQISTAWTEQLQEQVIQWRRHLHQYPELSFREHQTAAYIEQELRKLASELDGEQAGEQASGSSNAQGNGQGVVGRSGRLAISRPTPTSVLAVLKGGYPGPVLAIRADIDALPIQEQTAEPFISRNDGVMHACGHDGHTAMLLGTVKLLAPEASRLHGEIRFIFQHAEELPPGGAQELVDAGVIDGVDWIIGEHLSSLLPVGTIGIGYGATAASPDNFTITIQGSGGHAGSPHRAVDPIAIGAQIVTNLQHLVARNVDPIEKLVVSVTQFTAGSSHNVIPDTALLRGTVRSFAPEVRQQAREQLERIVAGITAAHGASYELDYLFGYHPVVNTAAIADIARAAAAEVVGEPSIILIPPGMGGEDFSAYLQCVPGTFIIIGAGNVERGIVHPHHHPQFAFDEAALLNGVKEFVNVAGRLLQWEPLT